MSPKCFMSLPTSFSVCGICLWRPGAPSFSVNTVQSALISSVVRVIGSRMDKWPKQSQAYTALSHLLELLSNRDPFCLPLFFGPWGHELEATVSHRATNGGSLLGQRTQQAEGKWRKRQNLDLDKVWASEIRHISVPINPIGGLSQFVLSFLSFGIRRPPSLNLEGPLQSGKLTDNKAHCDKMWQGKDRTPWNCWEKTPSPVSKMEGESQGHC